MFYYSANIEIKVVSGDLCTLTKMKITLAYHPEIRVRESDDLHEYCFDEHYEDIVSFPYF